MRHRASAIIIQNNALLALYRKTAEQGVYYVLPGGGVEEGESPEEAVVRELQEEAGIMVRPIRRLHEAVAPDVGHYVYFILCEAPGLSGTPEWLEVHKQKPDNVYRFQWLPLCGLDSFNLLPEYAAAFIAPLENHRVPTA